MASVSSCVAASRFFTPDLRREFFSEYSEMLCKWSEDVAYACSNGGSKVVKAVPCDTPDKVRITIESGGTRIVHVNQVRVTRVDTSGESVEELAQFILKVKDDPLYRIFFKESIVDKASPTYDSSVLDVVFSDHINHGPGSSPRSLYGLRKLLLVVIALAPMLVIVQITFWLVTVLSWFPEAVLGLWSPRLRCLPLS